ncbi:uncharacterized protein BJ212DRAFT_1436787 [Suillus subaureus]|uniref:Rap-GAP domain-containing protein n=1 Tax=Suillus subaureus TaxID=48587 RepID=A0A9P7E0S2_9AGAM|nr:uncharacterized protein BJ212DRAFT_1436787 [Suillus subaureus]KAG1807772.1 hypothetical protein BJ212DRAFT_1436787 [Suillus subaureus]
MSRQQQDADANLRFRQRSNTTTFTPFAWRRKADTISTTVPPQTQTLTFDALIEALTPPAVPSLTHARSLATLIASQSPLPRPSVLNPVWAALCGHDSPSSLQAAGYEIMATFWERFDGHLGTADILQYFSLFLHTVWAPDVGEPRLRALRALTRGGTEVIGIEIPLISLLRTWTEGAFDAYMLGDAPDSTDRAERERHVELLATFLSSVLEQPESAARVSEGDLASVLQFYAGLLGRALTVPPLSSAADPVPSPPLTAHTDQLVGVKTTVGAHRRHPSSISIRSISFPNLPSRKHPAELMVIIYLDHLSSQLKALAPKFLTLILPVLLRAQAFFASPLPRVSIMAGRTHMPANLEDRIQKSLNVLFSGPYGSSCMAILKRHLLPPTDVGKDLHIAPIIALGAHRTLRNIIRQGLCTKMARAYICRLTSVSYPTTGAPGHKDLEKDLMERAWSKDDISGWDHTRLGRLLGKSVEAWVNFMPADNREDYDMEKDKIMDEAACTMRDIFQEFDEREDGVDMDDEEACVAGTILRQLANFVRPIRTTDGAPLILPLDQPAEAPTPFLRTLSSLLARDHSTYMIPLLSTTLFFIADHLTDADTAKLPSMMFEQHDLSPASPDWLKSWQDILSNPTLFAPTRALTRLEIMKALRSVYDSLKDMHSYRKSLADLVFDFCRMQADNPQEDLTFDSSVAWRILGDEVVLRAVEAHTSSTSVAPSSELEAPTRFVPVRELIDLLTAVAVERGVQEDDDDTGCANAGTPASPAFPSSSASAVVTPMLSRKQSEHRGGNVRDRDSNMPSVMSILSSLAGSRSQSQHSQEHESPRPPLVASPASEPILPRAAVAVVSLVSIFSQLAFTPHALLQRNVILAGQVFDTLVKLISQAKSPRTRHTVLQFTMRIRADRDHRLYFVDAHHDPDGNIMTLASLIGRIQGPSFFGQVQQSEDERTSSSDLNNDDSHVRKPQPRGPQERDGRRASRGRGIRPNQSAGSRSQSRASLPTPSPSTNQVKPLETLWQFPESLPLTSIDQDNPSEGIFSYDPVSESIGVLRIDSYLSAIFDVLEKERNWEILSYVLCHLPVQLANKHLFCGPKCREMIARLLTSLCSELASGGLASSIDRWPLGLKPRDAHGLAFHTLTVLISYSRRFDLPLRHAIVDVLREGLDSQPTTIICCLQALTLCAFELLSSLKRSLPSILEKLSQIMSNPDMAVHILSFLSIVGSIPALHANLREEDFKMVFGVALQYLQHHNRPCATPAMSWAMSQYVRMISFSVVYVWFLAVKLPHRPRHISYITRQLLLANEGKDGIDEPTEVCFDWLARYAYASADPRPARSTLSEIVMNPNNLASPEPAVSEKTWLSGNSVVTIRSLARLGWIEVLSRRPSGLTRFLCKLENIPLVGPGDVDPDMVSVAAGMMMERDVPRPERPDADVDQSLETNPRSDTSKTIVVRDDGGTVPPAPDPITGYVWSHTAPSQRRKYVAVDPAFFALQLSPYPDRNQSASQRMVDAALLPALFRSLDQIPVIDTHKVGIMYVAPGQTHELDILRNAHGSPAYTRFLEGIGRLINLRGQVDVYAGGLSSDEDGEYAYAWWDDIGQVLYHTATMMPSKPHDKYCVDKKRHIGNDYVRIVWNDSGIPYQFDTLATQFQFVNIIIEPHSLGAIAAFSNNIHENEYFKVTIQRASGMSDFTPVGDFKLISAEQLPLLVRQLSLLADCFASVFERTERDTKEVEVITNWRARLQKITTFKREKMPPPQTGGEIEGVIGQEAYRNFTATF